MESACLIMTLRASSKVRLGHLRAGDCVTCRGKCRTVRMTNLPFGPTRVVPVAATPALLSLLVSDRCLSSFHGVPFLGFQSWQASARGCCEGLVP